MEDYRNLDYNLVVNFADSRGYNTDTPENWKDAAQELCKELTHWGIEDLQLETSIKFLMLSAEDRFVILCGYEDLIAEQTSPKYKDFADYIVDDIDLDADFDAVE
jgi:hypothetical protein